MYVFLLWTRYLRTRRLAFICMGSVMLGVATLIVVNSVMSGFSTKLKERLHDLQSDIVIESTDPMVGFPMTADAMMARIRSSPAGEHIQAMAPSVELFAIMQFRFGGRNWTKTVRLVGIDPNYQKHFKGFSEYLLESERQASPSFDIGKAAAENWEQNHRPFRADELFKVPASPRPNAAKDDGLQLQPIEPERSTQKAKNRVEDLPLIDAPPVIPRKPHGIIVGHALASFRDPTTGKDVYVLDRGDSATIYTVGCETLEPVWDEFAVCDYVKTEMSDIDSSVVFVPLDYLQHLRTMEGRVNTLQIRLKDETEGKAVKEMLQRIFPAHSFTVSTWQDKQGVLLAAIAIERGILNVLLFMIIGVAGFGILAIFSMIVTEKTRDIGVLKSLGASHRGVLMIFLGYGLLLGLVGALLGTGLGVVFAENINWIESQVSYVTGHELFDRKIYYFNEIPTDIRWQHILAVDFGAVLIAVVFSILPAWTAARLHPVRALRYE